MITVTVTFNLTDDPHTFTTRDTTTGWELRAAVNLHSRTGTGDGPTCYLKSHPPSASWPATPPSRCARATG